MKNFKKFEKKIQKSCKKIAKILQKVVVKNLQNFCRIFAEFLQLHILQKVLHFRPREESGRVDLYIGGPLDLDYWD